MSKLMYKGDEYSYSELFELNKLSNKYRKGEVCDLESGEVWDIKDIRNATIREMYFDETFTKQHKINISKRKNRKLSKKELEEKFESGEITYKELYKLLKIKNQQVITPNYNYDLGYIIVNLNVLPDNISDTDLGKFRRLLHYLSGNHKNKLMTEQGSPVTKEYLSNKMGYKAKKYFNRFLRRLKKARLIDEREFGGINYIIINPAYARKNMVINPTIYKIFKEDLDKCLTRYQIKFLEMSPDGIEIGDMIRLDD